MKSNCFAVEILVVMAKLPSFFSIAKFGFNYKVKHNYYHQYESNNYYHIYNHACGTKNIFIDHSDFIDFLEKFDKYFLDYFDLVAYCLMPNHFHLCVMVKDETLIKDNITTKSDSSAQKKYLEGFIDLDALLSDQYRRFLSIDEVLTPQLTK
jgi:REP element-mobilizing transposase RayT